MRNNNLKSKQPNIVKHESTNTPRKVNEQKIIRYLKDEIREYKRQIKVLKRAIENLNND
tara:strand:+ start:288 stop:464 length:177 start_codon:yes stop_codon:yes gene_type:complete